MDILTLAFLSLTDIYLFTIFELENLEKVELQSN